MFSVSQAALRLGVYSTTKGRWDTNGLISCWRTPGGHRRIILPETNRLLGNMHRKIIRDPPRRRCAVYARVSGHRHKPLGALI